jgi:hypothetical protein
MQAQNGQADDWPPADPPKASSPSCSLPCHRSLQLFSIRPSFLHQKRHRGHEKRNPAARARISYVVSYTSRTTRPALPALSRPHPPSHQVKSSRPNSKSLSSSCRCSSSPSPLHSTQPPTSPHKRLQHSQHLSLPAARSHISQALPQSSMPGG